MRKWTVSSWRWAGLLCLLTTMCMPLMGKQSNFSRARDEVAEPTSPAAVQDQSPATTLAAIPHLIKFSGTLYDLSGKAIAGPVDVTFSLYAQQSGGSALWFETQTVQADALGDYTVLLGAMTPTGVPMELFTSGEAHWLGVQVANLPEQPRVLLVSVPYAMKAGDAETLGGKPASDYLLASQAGSSTTSNTTSLTNLITKGSTSTTTTTSQSPVTNTITASYIPVYTDSLGTTGNSIMFQSGTKIGINTNTPVTNLDLNGAIFMLGPKAAAPGQGGTMRFRDDAGIQRWLFGIPGVVGSQDFFVYNYTNGHEPIYVQNGAASNSLYLAGSGNVGIGTTSPSAKLEVNGTAKFDQPVTFAASQSFGGATSVLTGSTETLTGSTSDQVLNVNQTGSGAAAVINTTGAGEILSGRKGGVEKFGVDASGNVTIAGNLNLPQNTGSSLGVITLGGEPFISACCEADYGNTFLGPAGNFTLTGEADTGSGSGALFFLTSGNFNTANGFGALEKNASGSNNTALGANALSSNTTGSENTATGSSALFLNGVGSDNTADGFYSLLDDVNGQYNTAVGSYSLRLNVDGSEDSALGYYALNANTTGNYNTAGGSRSMYSNTTGGYNDAVGWGALYTNTIGSHNTAFGAGALYDNTDASANTAVGANALFYNCAAVSTGCTGYDNTALGYNAGVSVPSTNSNVTGNYDTFLGANTGTGTSTQLNYATAIGANALVSESNALVLGGTGDAAVKVGIGTDTPQAALDVYGGDIYIGPIAHPPFSVAANALYLNNDAGDVYNTFRLDGYANDLAIVARSASGAAAGASISFRTGTAGGGEAERVRIDSSGNVGIGTTAPSAALDVVGDVQVSGCVQANGQSLGSCASTSDRRLKTNIRPIGPVLDRLVELQPVHFNWNPDNPPQYRFGSQRNAGLIAQQVREVFPKMVTTGKDGYMRVYYHELPFLTLEAVRELKTRNDSLRGRVLQEDAEIAGLERSNDAKESRLDSLAAQNRRLATEVRQLQKQAAIIAILEARLNRDELEQRATRAKLVRMGRRQKKQNGNELARVNF